MQGSTEGMRFGGVESDRSDDSEDMAGAPHGMLQTVAQQYSARDPATNDSSIAIVTVGSKGPQKAQGRYCGFTVSAFTAPRIRHWIEVSADSF
jgi:hypothetical protein